MMILENRLTLPSIRSASRIALATLLLTTLGACSHPTPAPDTPSTANTSPQAIPSDERVEPQTIPSGERVEVEEDILTAWVLSPDALSTQARQTLLNTRCEQGDIQACIYAGALDENWESLRSYCAQDHQEACAILGTYGPFNDAMANAHQKADASIFYRMLTAACPGDANCEEYRDAVQALYREARSDAPPADAESSDVLTALEGNAYEESLWADVNNDVLRHVTFFDARSARDRCHAALDKLEADPNHRETAEQAELLCRVSLTIAISAFLNATDDALAVAEFATASRQLGHLARAMHAMRPAEVADIFNDEFALRGLVYNEPTKTEGLAAQYELDADKTYERALEIMKACGCGHWALIEDFVR